MTTLPLLPENPDTLVVAYHQGRAIDRATFRRDVAQWAERLPAGRPILNLCHDRYLFAVALFAAISRGATSLLPNSTTAETLAALQAREPDLLCLSDRATAPEELPHWQVAVAPDAALHAPPLPQIPADQRVAWVFTSGSTGTPQAHAKYFGPLVAISMAEARRLWAITGEPCAIVGTVPPQHMYGLESTVLLPLLGGGILSASRPYYPADIAAAIDALPAPRLLVTTPYHLRTLLEAHVPTPALAAVLSATAPLSRELAQQAESALGAPLIEIYGATEVGQIASRQPRVSERWTLFESIRLTQEEELTLAQVSAKAQPVALGDVFELLDAQHFHLLGRSADMINIAGKRSSLAFLNSVILRLPGVVDAVFCLPFEGETGRLAAFVVAPGVTAHALRQGLRSYVDPVFLPRPIIFVESLPRNETGKITAATLDTLISAHLKGTH